MESFPAEDGEHRVQVQVNSWGKYRSEELVVRAVDDRDSVVVCRARAAVDAPTDMFHRNDYIAIEVAGSPPTERRRPTGGSRLLRWTWSWKLWIVLAAFWAVYAAMQF